MAPLRNTVNFINGKKCDPMTFCKPFKWLYKSAERTVENVDIVNDSVDF